MWDHFCLNSMAGCIKNKLITEFCNQSPLSSAVGHCARRDSKFLQHLTGICEALDCQHGHTGKRKTGARTGPTNPKFQVAAVAFVVGPQIVIYGPVSKELNRWP